MIYTDTDSLKIDDKQTYVLTLEQIVDIVKYLQGDCEIRTPCARWCLNNTKPTNCDHAIASAILSHMIISDKFNGGEKRLTKEELDNVREYIISNIVRNPNVMFDDNIRNDDYEYAPDLVEVIVNLYELLHIEVTGKEYNYMFHWANKIGSWVDTDINILKGGSDK